MTLIEPAIVGGIASYVFLPLASYALGFEPSLSWQYVAFFGLMPILLSLPAIFPVAITASLLGEASRSDRIYAALVSVALSIAVFLGVSHWLHAPVTGFQAFALAVSSPFIAGVGIGILGVIGIQLKHFGARLFAYDFGN